MPVIAPIAVLIANAMTYVTSSWVTAMAVGNFIASAIVYTAASAALSLLSSLLTKKPKPTSMNSNGLQINGRLATDQKRVSYGDFRSGGTWVFGKATSSTGLNLQDLLHIVVDWGEGVQEILKDYEQPFFLGQGQSGLKVRGTYSGATYNKYVVFMDGTTTFKWSDDNGATWEATGVAITGGWQALNNGLEIQFQYTSGYTVGNKFEFFAGDGIWVGDRLIYYYQDIFNKQWIWHNFHSGTATQTVDTDLQGYFSKWNNPKRHSCYSYFRLKKEFSTETQIWKSVPDFRLRRRKIDIYDPRTGVKAYSNNRSLVWFDYKISKRYGEGKEPNYIDVDSVEEAANWYDTNTCFYFNGIIIDLQEHGENLKNILDGGRAYKIDDGVIQGIKVWDDDTSEMTFTDFEKEVDIDPKSLSITVPGMFEAPNIITAAFINSENGFTYDEAFSKNSARITSMGREIEGQVELLGITDKQDAARIAQFIRRRGEYSKRFKILAHPKCSALLPGNMFTVTHEFPGWSSTKVRLDQIGMSQGGMVPVVVMEENSTIYSLVVDYDTTNEIPITPPLIEVVPPIPTNTTENTGEDVETPDYIDAYLTLKWDYMGDSISYEIRLKQPADTEYIYISIPCPDSNPYPDQCYKRLGNLACGATIEWEIRSVKLGTPSGWTPMRSKVLWSPDALSVPTNLTETTGQDTDAPDYMTSYLEVLWDYMGEYVNYQLQMKRTASTAWTCVRVGCPASDPSPTQMSYRFPNLECGAEFEWQIQSEKNGRYSDWSTSREKVLWSPTALVVPTNLTETTGSDIEGPDYSSAFLKCFWDYMGSGVNYEFAVKRTIDADWSFQNVFCPASDPSPTQMSVYMGNKECGAEYQWKIRSEKNSRWSAWSGVRTKTLWVPPPVPVPEGLDEETGPDVVTPGNADGYLIVKWTYVGANYNYEIRWIKSTATDYTYLTISDPGADPAPNKMTYRIGELFSPSGGISVDWQIRAEKNGRYSDWSGARTKAIWYPTPPVVVTGMSETPATWNEFYGKVTCNWTSLGTDYTYQIEMYENGGTEPIDFVWIPPQIGNLYVFTGYLVYLASYQWRVRGISPTGEYGTWTALRTFTMVTGPPNWIPPSSNPVFSDYTEVVQLGGMNLMRAQYYPDARSSFVSFDFWWSTDSSYGTNLPATPMRTSKDGYIIFDFYRHTPTAVYVWCKTKTWSGQVSTAKFGYGLFTPHITINPLTGENLINQEEGLPIGTMLSLSGSASRIVEPCESPQNWLMPEIAVLGAVSSDNGVETDETAAANNATDNDVTLAVMRVQDSLFGQWDDVSTLTYWTKAEAGTSHLEKEMTPGVLYGNPILDVDGSNSAVSIRQTIGLKAAKNYTLVIGRIHDTLVKTAKIQVKDSAANVYLKSDGTWDAGEQWIALPQVAAANIAETYSFPFTTHASYTAYVVTFQNDSAATSKIWITNIRIDPESGADAFYLIGTNKFNGYAIEYGTGFIGSLTNTHQYWDGSDWVTLTVDLDNVGNFDLNTASHNQVRFEMPSDWESTTVAGVTGYAIRILTTDILTVTVPPRAKQIWLYPIGVFSDATRVRAGNSSLKFVVPAGSDSLKAVQTVDLSTFNHMSDSPLRKVSLTIDYVTADYLVWTTYPTNYAPELRIHRMKTDGTDHRVLVIGRVNPLVISTYIFESTLCILHTAWDESYHLYTYPSTAYPQFTTVNLTNFTAFKTLTLPYEAHETWQGSGRMGYQYYTVHSGIGGSMVYFAVPDKADSLGDAYLRIYRLNVSNLNITSWLTGYVGDWYCGAVDVNSTHLYLSCYNQATGEAGIAKYTLSTMAFVSFLSLVSITDYAPDDIKLNATHLFGMCTGAALDPVFRIQLSDFTLNAHIHAEADHYFQRFFDLNATHLYAGYQETAAGDGGIAKIPLDLSTITHKALTGKHNTWGIALDTSYVYGMRRHETPWEISKVLLSDFATLVTYQATLFDLSACTALKLNVISTRAYTDLLKLWLGEAAYNEIGNEISIIHSGGWEEKILTPAGAGTTRDAIRYMAIEILNADEDFTFWLDPIYGLDEVEPYYKGLTGNVKVLTENDMTTISVKSKSQEFLEDGIWICPDGVTSIVVSLLGDGAGGGGGDTSGAYGGGGGGGGELIYRKPLTVVPGTQYDIFIGPGGLPGAAGLVGGDGNGTHINIHDGAAILTAAGGKASSVHMGGGAGGGALGAPEVPSGDGTIGTDNIEVQGGSAGGSGLNAIPGSHGGNHNQYLGGVHGTGNRSGGGGAAGYRGPGGDGGNGGGTNPGTAAGANTGAGGGGGGGFSSGTGGAGGDGGSGWALIEWVGV